MTTAARRKLTAPTTAANYWRTNIMLKKNVPQGLWFLGFTLFLFAGAEAQSTPNAATPSANPGSSVVAESEQQEMRDELRALRAEVERLRAEVEQQKVEQQKTSTPSA